MSAGSRTRPATKIAGEAQPGSPPASPPLAAAGDHRASQAAGTVFEHTDGSLRPGCNPIPIEGVLVSNGRDITRTDARGRWSLPVRDGESLFVIKPTGWMTPVDPVTRLPRFAHPHCPAGTPDLGMFYAGLPATGPLPASIDFPLTRQDEPDRFDVLLLADPQPQTPVELDFFRDDVLARMKAACAPPDTPGAGAAPPAFGITLGDIMFDDLAHYDRHNRVIATLGLPWYNLPGNHDMNMDAPSDRYSRETFKSVYGARHYAWQYGGATFVAFDNVEHLGGRTYRGRFGETQLAFLRRLIAAIPPASPLVLCMHIPLRTIQGCEANTATTDWEDLLAVIGERANTISVSGHTHTSEHLYLGGAAHHHQVLTAACGSWWSGPVDGRGIPEAVATDGTPNGFHILNVAPDALTTRLVAAHTTAPMRIMIETEPRSDAPDAERHDGAIRTREGMAARLVVNLFDGGPRSRVAFSLDGGATTTPMTRTERRDPFFEALFARYPKTCKPWVEPSLSAHLWQAMLPSLERGSHDLRVLATDEFGRAVEASQSLDVS